MKGTQGVPVGNNNRDTFLFIKIRDKSPSTSFSDKQRTHLNRKSSWGISRQGGKAGAPSCS